MASTIRYGESFTIEQVLNSDGFTLDTGEIEDLMEDLNDPEPQKSVELTNDEILKFLNVEDDTGIAENNEHETVSFLGLSFDKIKPKMHSITSNNEILKLVQRKGTGNVVPNDAQVTVQYVGYFEFQDEPFDSTFFSRDKKKIFNLGRGSLIQGLEVAICSMKKHEKSLFIIQPRLAYGKLGCLPRIPPDSEVLFSIELIDFVDNGQAESYDDLNDEEKKKFSIVQKIVEDLLKVAAYNFKIEKTKLAINDYAKAQRYLESARLENDQEEQEMNKLLTRTLTNSMVCYNKVGKPTIACALFERLPTKSNAKAFFQYGKALRQLSDYDKAKEALQKAYKLTPSNEDILKEIKKVEEARQKYLEFSKRFAQKSLNLENVNSNDDFEEVAIEMCQAFVNDSSQIKQEIPSGLTTQEQDCIRRVAASIGLSITIQNRRGEETLYLTKKNACLRNQM